MKNKYIFFFVLIPFFASSQPATHLVISQVYGGGGNTGAQYNADYIELFNPTSTPVSLSGWSLQYAAATGTNWIISFLTGTIAPNAYFLVQEGASGSNGSPLPAFDSKGTLSLSATGAKVALCNSSISLTGSCPIGGNIIDFVGYGSTTDCYEGAASAPAASNTTAIFRADSGCTDSEQNGNDFSAATPLPRNSSVTHSCTGTLVKQPVTETHIELFPNPVTNILNIPGLRTIEECVSIEIYSSEGKKMFEKRTDAQHFSTQLDVAGLPEGVYFVMLSDNKRVLRSSFLKQSR